MIRLLVADDHAIVREGLKLILSAHEDIQVVGEAGDGTEAMAEVVRCRPDVVLLDMIMPGRSGIELIKEIRGRYPKQLILVLTVHNQDQYAVRAIKAGARGYLTKGSDPGNLVTAIRKVASGQYYITPEVAERLAVGALDPHQAPPHARLSDREYQVFLMLVEGLAVTEIARQLYLSSKTVSTHKARILQKLGVNNVAELIRYAIDHDLLPDNRC